MHGRKRLTNTSSPEGDGEIQAGRGVCRCGAGDAGESVGVGYVASAYVLFFSRGVSLRGDPVSGVVLLGAQGLVLMTLDL